MVNRKKNRTTGFGKRKTNQHKHRTTGFVEMPPPTPLQFSQTIREQLHLPQSVCDQISAYSVAYSVRRSQKPINRIINLINALKVAPTFLDDLAEERLSPKKLCRMKIENIASKEELAAKQLRHQRNLKKIIKKEASLLPPPLKDGQLADCISYPTSLGSPMSDDSDTEKEEEEEEYDQSYTSYHAGRNVEANVIDLTRDVMYD
jgi:hypothetical protein